MGKSYVLVWSFFCLVLCVPKQAVSETGNGDEKTVAQTHNTASSRRESESKESKETKEITEAEKKKGVHLRWRSARKDSLLLLGGQRTIMWMLGHLGMFRERMRQNF